MKEERLRKKKSVKVQKIRVEKNDNDIEKKEKLLRKVIVRIENNRLGFYFILFYFYFIFLLSYRK